MPIAHSADDDRVHFNHHDFHAPVLYATIRIAAVIMTSYGRYPQSCRCRTCCLLFKNNKTRRVCGSENWSR